MTGRRWEGAEHRRLGTMSAGVGETEMTGRRWEGAEMTGIRVTLDCIL